METFSEVKVKSEYMIKSGGLCVDSKYSQVHSDSYHLLANINRVGFITIDSQDAYGLLHDGQVNLWERPYINGFVLSDDSNNIIGRLEKLCESSDNNYQLVIHQIIAKETRSTSKLLKLRIPVTEHIVKFKRVPMTHIYMAVPIEEFEFQCELLNLTKTNNLRMITIIDLTYNKEATYPNGLFAKVSNCLCA